MSWIAVRLFLSSVPRWVWGVLAVGVLLGAVWLHGRATGADGVQAKWDAQEAVYAQQRAASAIAARNTEARWRAEYAAIAGRFIKEQTDAEQAHAAVVAGLRAGTVRVRDRLRCPASAGMPQAPADSGRAAQAGEGGFSVADAEVVLRAGADADAIARQLNALIEAVEAGRK